MTPSQIQTQARALVAYLNPTATDAIVVAVESYGQRRLYPITDAADALAALVGARTLDERHLGLARRLCLKATTTTIDALTDAATRRAEARAINRDQRAAYCDAVERGETPPPPPAEIPPIV